MARMVAMSALFRGIQGSRRFMAYTPARDLYHELLPAPSIRTRYTGSEDYVLTLKEAGIARIAFIRHARTGKPPKDVHGVPMHDYFRKLSTVGRKQAARAGLIYGQDLRPFFFDAMASAAPRAYETAEIFLENALADELVVIGPVEEAYDGTMQPDGSALFKKIGYAPLRSYLTTPNEKDRATAQRILGEYAHSIADYIYMVAQLPTSRDFCESQNIHASTLLFVGHSIYLPAVALAVASLTGCDDKASTDLILDKNTGEAEGFLVDVAEGNVQYLSNPPPKKGL